VSTSATKKENSQPETAQLFTPHAIDEFAAMLSSMPDPDLVLESVGMRREELRKLESDDEITTALETRRAAVHATPWTLEPGAGRDFDLIYPQLQKHLETMIDIAWEAIPYGYSVAEVVYAKDGGTILWDHIEERPFEWFEPRSDGKLRYYPASGAEVADVFQAWPGQFFLTRRRPKYRNPYGEALLSRIYWAWYFRTNGWKFWAKFLERFGAPLLVGQTSGNTKKMAEALAAALQSAVAAVGKEDTITAISPANAGDAFDRFSVAVDKRIQKVILGQTLTTDVQGGGSYAAAKVQDTVRDDRRMGDIKIVTGTVQSMIDTLLILNRRQPGSCIFKMQDETGLQADRAQRDKALADGKIVKFTSAYIVKAYDLDEEDFTIPEDAPAPAPAAPGQQQTPPAGQKAQPKDAKASLQLAAGATTFTPEQQEVERIGDELNDSLASPIPPAAIAKAIRASRSPEELAEKLADVYEGNDPAEFREALERALFTADVLGYVHLDEYATKHGGND
jgi:phage gp29-like protein